MKKILPPLLMLLFGVHTVLHAQSVEPDLVQINEDRISMNKNGMLILGSWAIGNIAIGGIAMTQTSGNVKYFHQMNAAWNTVNLAIAGFGYYGLRNQSTGLSLSETIHEYHNFEKILLFNAGLDIGYMAIGAYLWERGIRTDSSRLRGYGQSMILQGGFLFTFDVILYILSRTQSSSLIDSLDNLQFSGNGLSLTIPF